MNMFSGIIVACRYFVKNKFSSLINITGLAIGLTGFTCIMLYVEHELSFDQFHTRHADIYRVVKDFVNPDGSAASRCHHTSCPGQGPSNGTHRC